MRRTTASNKRNSSSSSSSSSPFNASTKDEAANQQSGQRKSAKGSSADLGGGCSRPTPASDNAKSATSSSATTPSDQQATSANESKQFVRLGRATPGTKKKQHQQQDRSNYTDLIGETRLNRVLTPVDHVDDHRKHSHCEIEKRRRDKMNNYIMELASVIPSFNNKSKFDKLTVLKMAVQHVKSLRNSLCSFSSFHLRPSFLSSGNLLKNLILQMASQESQDSLFMVVSCDRGKVLFASQSSKDILNQNQNDLVGQCLFDILHKDDVSKVKEQISHFNLMPKEMLVDSKTLQPIKYVPRQSFSQLQNQSNSTPQPGARRSFFCRMKGGRNHSTSNQPQQKEESESLTLKNEESSASEPNATSTNSVSLVGGRTNNDKDEILTKQQQDNQQKSTLAVNSSRASNYHDSIMPELSRHQDSELKTNTNCLVSESNTSVKNNSDVKIVPNKVSNFESTNNTNNIKCMTTRSNSKDKSDKSSSSSSVGSVEMGSDASSSGIASGSSNDEQLFCNENSTFRKRSSNTKRTNNDDKTSSNISSSNNSSSKKHLRYIVMHCTGYLKSITLGNNEFDEDDFDDYTDGNNSSDEEENDSLRTINCFVAVCRRSSMETDIKPDRPLTFTCRYSMEGKFVFVDQRTTIALGYTPQQLLGTSHYAYCHKDSVNTFKECHRQSILKSEPVSSDIYQFKRANGQHLWLQTSLKSFRNPWTKIIDYIVANHTTAEGNDPHYNEGCVPTKFNQDMTGEGSQSSSLASSSLYLPSMNSKKSSSPSSSSIGSSHSMDSYASGANIQVLLDQIDRVKSGGVKHALDFRKKRSGHTAHSSTRKSNEDSGNCSDPQSISSLAASSSSSSSSSSSPPSSSSPQNSGLSQNSSGIINMQGNFVDNANNQSAIDTISNTNMSNNYYQKTNGYGPQQGLCAPVTYQQSCEQPFASNPNCSFDVNNMTIAAASKYVADDGTRSQFNATKQHHRQYNVQYGYRNQTKSSSLASLDTGYESTTWTNSSAGSYSNRQTQPHRSDIRPIVVAQDATVMNETQHSNLCNVPMIERTPLLGDKINRHPQHVLPNAHINMVSAQLSMEDQMNIVGETQSYSNLPTLVNTYMNQGPAPRYDNNVSNINSSQMNNELQSNVPMPIHLTEQGGRMPQDGNPNQMNVPMMWNATDNPYQNIMHPTQPEQMCTNEDMSLMNVEVENSNNQIITHQIFQCQQCVNHKCSNQVMMANNSDLNSINLTSLAVDGDLDEDQLLEYLAGCDPEAQLDPIQNNAFMQNNIYR